MHLCVLTFSIYVLVNILHEFLVIKLPYMSMRVHFAQYVTLVVLFVAVALGTVHGSCAPMILDDNHGLLTCTSCSM